MSTRGGPGRFIEGGLRDRDRARPVNILLKRLWGYLKQDKHLLYIVAFVIMIYSIINTLTPILIQQAIDKFNTLSSNQIDELIIAFLVLSFIIWVFDSLSTWISAEIQANLVHNIRSDTFDYLVDADMKFHHTQQSGNITSRVVGDTEEVGNGINIFTTMASQLLLVFTTFLLLFYLSPIFALIAALSIPIAFIMIKVLSKIGGKRMLKARQSIGHVTGKIAESLNGISISKSFNREEATSREIRQLNEEYYDSMVKLGIVFTMVMPSIRMISTILVAFVLVSGGFIGTSVLTIGTIYLGTIMIQRFLMPIVNIGGFATQLQASLAAFDRLIDIQESKPAIHDSENALELHTTTPSISFDDVYFEYNKGEPVLQSINFKVEPGQKVALVGHTGAGKTTISSLLMRFYDPIQGSIKIDNHDLREITQESLLNTISLVPQEPYLFADTVLENLKYGRPETTDEDVYAICSMIGADQFIEALPKSFNTVLKESGKSLSAGQRQMITIARTMIRNPKILVLDEATSRLDAYSESLVQKAQQILFENRTTIVIAHRLSTIKDVDSIVVLDHGKIIEQGTNEELLENKGKYYELYKTYYVHQGVSELRENGQIPDIAN